MLNTRFMALFEVERQITHGGMQWVGRAELIAAVSNASALGIFDVPPALVRNRNGFRG